MKAFDLSLVPFSCAGSYLKVGPPGADARPRRLVISTLRGLPRALGTADLYGIALVRDGREVRYEWTASPWQLDLRAREGRAAFAFGDPDTLCFSATGVGVELVPRHATSWESRPAPDRCVISDFPARCFHYLRAGRGAALEVEVYRGPGAPKGLYNDKPRAGLFRRAGGASGALRILRHEGRWDDPLLSAGEAAALRKAEWRAWLAKMPRVPAKYREAAERAWFINRVSLVEPDGAITRRTLLMSKNWMTKVWSWDNCFNALGVAKANPVLAWDQLKLMFDHQAPSGMLPDSVDDSEAIYQFVKPPVYGWTVMGLVRELGLARCRKHIKELYGPISWLTEWWYACRDTDGDGMCQYHHGNDSGWDNATAFDQGCPTEGSDLAAHLALQTEALSFMAGVLGKRAEARAWKRRSERQLRGLLRRAVKGDRFFSPLDGKSSARDTSSLLNYVPMVLGHRLPERIRRRMAKDLGPGGPFLTRFGLATQAPGSPLYEPDGYWRGPIWAPSTYLILDGLRDAGETELARIIAERFCDMCAMQDGMYENYEALTGKGLRDPGYTWTASVFVLLANWLGEG